MSRFTDFIVSILPKGLRDRIEENKQKKLQAGAEESLRLQCKADGRETEYQDYLQSIESHKRDIEMYEGYLRDGIEDAPRWKYALKQRQMEMEFLRPNNPKDIEERNYWANNFYKEFVKVYPESEDLRFHGTSIFNTKAILESGGIFSSVDINDGYMASTDLSGEISASSRDSLDRTIQFFTDMGSYIRSLPAGCVFVMNPRTDKDRELKRQDAMESVNFKEHPEQFYGIFTTNENLPIVKEWVEKAGLDPNKAYNFQGFLDKLKEEKNKGKESMDHQKEEQKDLKVEKIKVGDQKSKDDEEVR
ncbi:MAG: hypothetical protein IKN74_06325 [Clostridia bacterium]|nr:hypothetical protein [Clostridia bacterium]